MYDSVNQAHMRLRNSWLRYKDNLVKVIEVKGNDANIKLAVMDVYGDLLEYTINLNDPALILEYPELGYLNDPNYNVCGYWYKRPGRIQRQGLVTQDLMCLDQHVPQNMELAIQECVFNRYESLQECFDRLDGVEGSIAFNKEYCIHTYDIGPNYLEHRGSKVGWWTSNDIDSLVLDRKYLYLLENLQHKYGVKANEHVG